MSAIHKLDSAISEILYFDLETQGKKLKIRNFSTKIKHAKFQYQNSQNSIVPKKHTG